MKLISLHGKNGSAVPFVCYNKKVFALTGGRIKAEDVIQELCDAGLDQVRVHVSPNSGNLEAACAGALDIQLGGDACYFGKLYKKETLGDPLREAEPEDIRKAVKLMYGTSVLLLIIMEAVRIGLVALL